MYACSAEKKTAESAWKCQIFTVIRSQQLLYQETHQSTPDVDLSELRSCTASQTSKMTVNVTAEKHIKNVQNSPETCTQKLDIMCTEFSNF